MKKAKKVLAFCVIQLMVALAFTLLLTPTHRAEADFTNTWESVNITPGALYQLGKDLENKKVAKAFEVLGYDAQEIQARLDGLDDNEVRLLAGELENSMVPSGDGTTALILGAVALVLLIALAFFIMNGLRGWH